MRLEYALYSTAATPISLDISDQCAAAWGHRSQSEPARNIAAEYLHVTASDADAPACGNLTQASQLNSCLLKWQVSIMYGGSSPQRSACNTRVRTVIACRSLVAAHWYLKHAVFSQDVPTR